MLYIQRFRIALVLSALVLIFYYVGHYFVGRTPTLIVIDSLLVGMFVATAVSLRKEAFSALRRGIADGSDAFITGTWSKAVFFSLYFLYVIYYSSLGVPGVQGPSPAQLALRASPASGTLHSLILIAQSYILFSPVGVPKESRSEPILLALTVAAAIGGLVAGVVMTLGFVGLFQP